MDITSTQDGGTAVFNIVGAIDSATSKAVEQALDAAITAGGHNVVLDMRQVNYVSSAGLRAILVTAKKAKFAGGGVAIFGLQPSVNEVFTAAGFSTIVSIASTDAQARQLLGV